MTTAPMTSDNLSEQNTAPRYDAYRYAGEAVTIMQRLEGWIGSHTLGSRLLNLVRMRASQINGCAHCLNMHAADARTEGESEQRLYLLNAWRETALYTTRERAALAWTESLTLISESGVPDALFEEVSKEFSEEELAALTLAVASINSWNRLAISVRMPVLPKDTNVVAV